MRVFIAVLLVVLIVPFLSCVDSQMQVKPEPEAKNPLVVDYNVYPADISGNTVEERLESFASVSNEKTKGFSVILYEYNTEEQIIEYYVMVYDKRQVIAVREEDVVLSSELNTIIGQTFWFTGGIVPPEIKKIKIYFTDTFGHLIVFEAAGSEIRQLPLGAWRDKTTIIKFKAVVVKEFPPTGYTPPPWNYY